MISADSHPVQGAFTFSVGKPSASAVNPSAFGATGSKAVGMAYAMVRALAFASFAVLVGDVAHLSAMAVWLGGLVVLAGVVLSAAAPVEQGDAVKAVRRFSSVAMCCVITLVVTGSYQAWRAVGTSPALTGTAYGRLLLFKLWAMSVPAS